MKENVMRLMTLGKIPNDNDMTNELFDQYDKLIQMEHALTYEERRYSADGSDAISKEAMN